jgi:8-oxo-dGTP pyrophosphatase MutT (NUDIX family)
MQSTQPRKVSAGVILTDGQQFLVGHVTGQTWWDIPKGVMEPDEQPRQTAIRELREETGVVLNPNQIKDLGRYAYRPDKDLHLFLYCRHKLPDPAHMLCSTFVSLPERDEFPEADDYQYIPFEDKDQYLSFNMNRVIAKIEPRIRMMCGK